MITFTLFSPQRVNGRPERIRDRVRVLAEEDGVEGIGEVRIAGHEATFAVDEELAEDVFGWIDDVALAEGYGLRTDTEVLRFGDEDLSFMYQLRGDDDSRLGASRAGLEAMLESMSDDEDFIKIIRFDLDDPGNEDRYIVARSFANLASFTLEVNPPKRKTIVADTKEAAHALAQWMDGDNLDNLAWSAD